MCSGPGADTALFRHLMAVLGMPAGAAAVPWGSRSEHTARGLQAAPSGESRQAGRQELWLGAGYCGENIGLFPSTQYMGWLWDHLCFAEDQPGARSTCAVSVGSAGFHLQCVLVVYDPLHRWNAHLWAELVAGYFPHGLCSRPFGWAKGGSLPCWWWFQRFFLAIL